MEEIMRYLNKKLVQFAVFILLYVYAGGSGEMSEDIVELSSSEKLYGRIVHIESSIEVHKRKYFVYGMYFISSEGASLGPLLFSTVSLPTSFVEWAQYETKFHLNDSGFKTIIIQESPFVFYDKEKGVVMVSQRKTKEIMENRYSAEDIDYLLKGAFKEKFVIGD